MFLGLLAALAYKRSLRLEDVSGLWRLSTPWRFGSGGTFSVTLTEISPPGPLFVGLLTSSESMAVLLGGHSEDLCRENVSSDFGYARLFQSLDTFNGTIHNGATLTLWWLACPHSGNDKATYNLDVHFVNPNTLLSLNEYPMVFGMPIVTAVVTVFLILWFVNWIRNFSFENKLHLLLTIAYVFTFIYYVMCCFNIVERHKSDEPSNMPMACRVMRVFQETILLTVMGLAAEGWYIIRPGIKWREVVISAFLAIAVCVPAAVIDYADMDLAAAMIVLVLFVVMGMLFYINLLRHVRRARKEVAAHLSVIQEQGINPKTTPIYKKYTMFRSLTVTVLAYFMLLFTRSVFMSVWAFPEWIGQLAYFVLLTAMMIIIGFFFKMKKETRGGYFMVGDEGGEPRVFNHEDIELMDTNFSGQTWSEEMALPVQPIIDFTSSRSHETQNDQDGPEARQAP